MRLENFLFHLAWSLLWGLESGWLPAVAGRASFADVRWGVLIASMAAAGLIAPGRPWIRP